MLLRLRVVGKQKKTKKNDPRVTLRGITKAKMPSHAKEIAALTKVILSLKLRDKKEKTAKKKKPVKKKKCESSSDESDSDSDSDSD